MAKETIQEINIPSGYRVTGLVLEQTPQNPPKTPEVIKAELQRKIDKAKYMADIRAFVRNSAIELENAQSMQPADINDLLSAASYRGQLIEFAQRRRQLRVSRKDFINDLSTLFQESHHWSASSELRYDLAMTFYNLIEDTLKNEETIAVKRHTKRITTRRK